VEHPPLEAVQLTKRYRGRRRPALDRVDLRIEAGSAVALVGPNGAGKSTLIRCFLGFERPSAGRVRVNGIDVGRDRTNALRHIGYVGQSPGLYRELSAEDHFALARWLRPRFDRPGSAAKLDDLGIPRTDPTGQLSGGQQAQVALVLATGTRAPILLLDEPLASLDPLARRDFLRIVAREVREHGTTVLIASHIVGALAALCNRVVVLAPAHVVLDENIATVTAHHAVVPVDQAVDVHLIGVFPDESGTMRALVRTAQPVALPASLDDVVLGYLAGSRDSLRSDAA
jgi:ABC-2 type transport system ATP-binding protein